MNSMNFCPNCFQAGGFNGNQCYLCGYQEKVDLDKRSLPPGVWLNGRYLLGRVLGIGGFGITYLAFDSQLRQRVAIKEYFPAEWATRTIGTNEIIANSMTKDELYTHGKDVFVNEANILLGLQNDSNVVDVQDFFVANGTAYLVMEYIEGASLSRHMKEKDNTLPIELANRVVQEVGDSLHKIHKHMLLHRDISPDNIMLSTKDEIKLIDFGATRIYALNSPKSMSILVKPGFAPIEQYSRSGKQGPWTDIYALAATYYYMVSGSKPPTAPDRESGVPLQPLNTKASQVPLHISEAITHALNRSWQNRPQSMKEFIREMQLQHRPIKTPILTPYLWLQTPSGIQQWMINQNSICVGRDPNECEVLLQSATISGKHCQVQYVQEQKQFLITNYSRNMTYTCRGTLAQGASCYILPGEWFCLKTNKQNFVFYVEVK